MQSETIVVIFPRQSGKNTLQAHIEAYLLWRYQWKPIELIKISPTWKPQSVNAMHRLEYVLQTNRITRYAWRKEVGYIYSIGKARLSFFSGSLHTNIVGATASLLLQVDEAQSIQCEKFDKDIAPMTASTNAPVVFWGTAWSAETLLGRELRSAQHYEKEDGRKRAFVLTATEVAKEVPSYGKFVNRQVERFGRNHPLIRTQFFSEELNESGKLFSSSRIALLQGTHSPQIIPNSNSLYALLLDIGGEDENTNIHYSGNELYYDSNRDSTALTVVEIDLTTLQDDLIKRPTYYIVNRKEWIGMNHAQLYTKIKALMEHWKARYCVIDASGLGMGISSFLQTAFPGKVIPFVFTSKTKSRLGWDFIALIESGRIKEYSIEGMNPNNPNVYYHNRYIKQLTHIEHYIKTERGQQLQWGVPAGIKDPLDGSFIHDDLVISTALSTCLDDCHWGQAVSIIIPPLDPIL